MEKSPQQVLANLHAQLDALPLEAYERLSGREAAVATQSLMRLGARVKAHQLAAARAVETSGEARRQGATSTGSLLASGFGGDRRAGDRLVQQADRIATATQTQEALGKGEVSVSQAQLIAKTLDSLPAHGDRRPARGVRDPLLCDAVPDNAGLDDPAPTDLRRQDDATRRSRVPTTTDRPAPPLEGTELLLHSGNEAGTSGSLPTAIPELIPPARLDPNRTPRRHARFTRAA